MGRSDIDFIDYATVAGSLHIRLIGNPLGSGLEARKPIDDLIRKAFVSSIPGYVIGLPERAAPEYLEGGGAAGVCGGAGPGDVAEYILEVDTPLPRCGEARGRQRLRIVNHLKELVVARLGHLVMFIPAGGVVTVKEPFERYLRPGGYSIDTTVYGGSGPELRFER